MVAPYITRGNTHIFWHAELSCSYRPVRRRNRFLVKQDVQESPVVVKEEREIRRVDSANLRDETRRDDMTLNNYVAADQQKPEIASPRETKKATSIQIVKYLLPDNTGLGETEGIQKSGKDVPTYPELLSPFEELLAAVVLSRSGPYQLGVQTINIMLNAPYGFRNPGAIKAAGPQKVKQAIAQAQHKERSPEEMEFLAEAIYNNSWHTDLIKLRRQARSGAESEREVLRRSIKGLGKNGLEIFYRRMQWLWKEAYPFVDSRAQASVEKLGLPARPDSLVRLIDVTCDDSKLEDLKGYSSDEKKRRAFVQLLDRAVSVDLEMRIGEVLEGASKL